jgi:glycosyltransferase involved in cell wall biosynthesis
MDVPAGGSRGQVVMFVRNDCTRDIRVLREAATLVERGFATTIVAVQPNGKSLPSDEIRGGVRIIRVPVPANWSRQWREVRHYPWRVVRSARRGFVDGLRGGRGQWLRALRIAVGATVLLPYAAIKAVDYAANRATYPSKSRQHDGLDWLIRWRHSFVGWARAAAAAAPSADVYHGHDLTGLPAALDGRRRTGGAARVVYDSHELFMEAGTTARQAGWARRVLAYVEGRWIRQVDGLITVNDSIAEELRRRYGASSAVIIRNTPPRQPTRDRPDHLRQAAEIPAEARIVLYHGGFQRDRGLEVLAEAMLEPEVAQAHLVYMGFGALQETLEALAREPRFGGRLHVLPAVSTEELLEWVASADVSAMPNQPNTLNEWYSTPNKLFESIAVGTPVVGSDFPERRRIVLDDPDGPLGAVCDPTDPRAVAVALGQVLGLEPAAAADLRRRCQKAAYERWNWELQTERLMQLYDRLVPIPG